MRHRLWHTRSHSGRMFVDKVISAIESPNSHHLMKQRHDIHGWTHHVFVDPRRCLSSGAICSKKTQLSYIIGARVFQDQWSPSSIMAPVQITYFHWKLSVWRCQWVGVFLLLFFVWNASPSQGYLHCQELASSNATTPAAINKYSSHYKQSCQFQIIRDLLQGCPGLSPCSDLGKESRGEMQTKSFS